MNQSRKIVARNLSICLGTLLLSSQLMAKKKDKIKLDAYVASEFEMESFKNGETQNEAKLNLESKRRNGIKAELGLRFRSSDNDVLIREALINKKFDDDWRLEFGYGRKPFGLEYLSGKRSRSTIDRSPIYRRLEVFTFVGRESMVHYYKKMDLEKTQPGYSLSVGHSDAQNLSFIGAWQKPLSSTWSFNYWLQLQSDHTDDGQQFVWAAMHSLAQQTNNSLFQFEFLAGVDPDESELRKLLGEDEQVRFLGTKLHYDQKQAIGDEEWWQWIVQVSGLVHDTELPDYNSIQLLLGYNYSLEPLRVGINLEGIGSTQRFDTKDRNFHESRAKLELLYDF